MAMLEIRFRHGLDYPDNHGIPLSDVAATLLAHERLMPLVSELLEQLVPGLTIDATMIALDTVQQGSLKETFFVAVFLAFQNDLVKDVPAFIGEVSGHPLPHRYDTIVTVLVVMLMYTGAKALVGRTRRPSSGESVAPHIEGDYNTYINIAADALAVSPELVERSLAKVVGRNRQAVVSRAAIDLFRPAKRGGDGRLLPRGLPEIGRESVAEFPTDLAFAELEKDTVGIPVPRARLDIRATDRDKLDKGWAGRITSDDLTTKRLPLVLSPLLDANELSKQEACEVEAILENRIADDGSTKPYRIHVMRVLND